MPRLKMVLNGLFAFLEQDDNIIIRLPYVEGHQAELRVPFLPPVSLNQEKPTSWNLTITGKTGNASVVDPKNELLCFEGLPFIENAPRFGDITIPRPACVSILSGGPMANEFEIGGSTAPSNPHMIQFADEFLLEFEVDGIPHLVSANASTPIDLSTYAIVVISGPSMEMDNPEHRSAAVAAAAAQFDGADVCWDGNVPGDGGGHFRRTAFIKAPGCSPSLGSLLK